MSAREEEVGNDGRLETCQCKHLGLFFNPHLVDKTDMTPLPQNDMFKPAKNAITHGYETN